MRAPIVLVLCSTLAACSTSENLPPMQPYVPPSMPTTAALVAGVKQAAAEAHLAAPLEMSDLRPTDHGPAILWCASAGYRMIFAPVFMPHSSMTSTRDRDCL
jgi:hypothetical protein